MSTAENQINQSSQIISPTNKLSIKTEKLFIKSKNKPSSITISNTTGLPRLNATPDSFSTSIYYPCFLVLINKSSKPRIGEVVVCKEDEEAVVKVFSEDDEPSSCFTILKSSHYFGDIQGSNRITLYTTKEIANYIELVGGSVVNHVLAGCTLSELYSDLKKEI